MSSGRGSGAVLSGRRRGRRQRPRRLRVRLPRPRPRVVVAIVAVLAVLGGAWLWVRQSSLVAVKRVSVAGASGPDATQIRAALVSAARDMTTLDVQMSHLRTAVSPYPVVKGLRVSTQFPHGMRIRVVEQVPVAMVQVDGRNTPVAGDGTLLRDVTTEAQLPSIGLSVAPGGTRLTGIARSEVELLAAAPYRLLVRVQLASSDSVHGLVVQLRDGPRLYFGGASQFSSKWDAVIEVLAAPSSASARYIDVTDATRPAAGSGFDDGSTTPSGAVSSGRSGGSTGGGTGTAAGG
jgi:cell division protein FtsQ